MSKKLLALVTTAFITMSVFVGCGTKSTDTSVNEPAVKETNIIEVASVSPLSGSQAALGESVKNGAQMALEDRVEEFSTLGFKLKFSPQDDQADPKVGVTVAQRLVNSKDTLGLVGHFNSGVAMPSSEIYKTDNLTMVSPANTAVKITERGIACVNRIVARDDVQGSVAAKFAFDTLKAKKAFVIHDKTTYGQGVADEFKKAFEKLKGETVGYEGITAGETDFNGVLTQVQAKKPDVVYFGGIYPEGGLIIKQMKAKNIKATFVGPDGVDSAELVKIAGDSIVGAYYTSTAGDILGTTKGAEWAKKYEAKFKKKSENYSTYGFDAMNVLLDGIKVAISNNGGKKPSRQQVSTATRATKGFEGVATKVTFDNKGDNQEASVFIYKFKEAKYPAPTISIINVKDAK